MPSPFRTIFKTHTRSHAPANASSTIDRATVTVVSQSEGVGSISSSSVSVSPARSAAIKGLKFALQHLGKAPVPGIELATSILLDVINRIQVNQEILLELKCTDLVQE